jgi:hypothetical protein
MVVMPQRRGRLPGRIRAASIGAALGRETPALAVSVFALAWVAGCGGTDYSAPPKRADRQQQQGCRSAGFSADRGPSGGFSRLGETFSVDLSDLTSTATDVSLTPSAAKVVGEVPDRFTDRGTYKPPAGYRFVAVTFTFGNAGTDEIEAADSVGNVFVLVTRQGQGWQRVDRTKGCTTISSSLATAAKLTDPETEVKPGASYTTLVVYSVPESVRQLVWFGAGHGVVIQPKAAE